MSGRKRRSSDLDGDDEEISDLLPNILVAGENFKSLTPEKIQRCLAENYNVKASVSQIKVALESGARLGLIQVKKRYCLNPMFALNPVSKKMTCDPCAD